ncbi:MAG: methylated-DNA--[protein]-cysteine S-methyltransferase [Acidobacteria bacterium]|nr:MAG: methylated-DNA--[protein]-cysteine S-methyltransferase [Acidobacteriota bacterium]
MLTVVSPGGLCGLEFDRPERSVRLWTRLGRWMPGHEIEDLKRGTEADRVVELTASWLEIYFRTGRDPEQAVTLSLAGTPFEQEVWALLRTIAAGETRSYAWVARELRRPDAARAVGAAVGANPVSLLVPCHRVVGTNGSLTGYGGGMDRKQWLLRHEGAPGIAAELFLDRETM